MKNIRKNLKVVFNHNKNSKLC